LPSPVAPTIATRSPGATLKEQSRSTQSSASYANHTASSSTAGELGRAGVSFQAAVLELVTKIPRGRVATYGQLAMLLGRPRSARAVGQALRRADGVPWHRVVNAQGGISRRSRMSGMMTQRILLEQEGIVFRRGRVVLVRFRWQGRRLNLFRNDGILRG